MERDQQPFGYFGQTTKRDTNNLISWNARQMVINRAHTSEFLEPSFNNPQSTAHGSSKNLNDLNNYQVNPDITFGSPNKLEVHLVAFLDGKCR